MPRVAPVPPLAPECVGHHDRFGTPQDVVRTHPGDQGLRAVATPHGRPRATRRRSVLVAVALAALLGPIGLLYSSRSGAVLTSVLFFLLTLPLVALWWKWVFVAAALTAPVCMTWAFVATVGHNAAQAFRRRRPTW